MWVRISQMMLADSNWTIAQSKGRTKVGNLLGEMLAPLPSANGPMTHQRKWTGQSRTGYFICEIPPKVLLVAERVTWTIDCATGSWPRIYG